MENLLIKYGAALAGILGALVYSLLRPAKGLMAGVGGFLAGASAAVFLSPVVVQAFELEGHTWERATAFAVGIVGKELIEVALSAKLRKAVVDRVSLIVRGGQ
jgi:hypothetical protein